MDCVFWLAHGILCIDGWLTLPPPARRQVEVILRLGGVDVRCKGRCLTGRVLAESGNREVRRWYVLISLDKAWTTASHVESITLATPVGLLHWLGGFDRLICADLRTRLAAFYPEMLHRLEGFVEKALAEQRLDLDDPVLHRNLALISKALWGRPPSEPAPRRSSDRSGEVERISFYGKTPTHPPVSLVLGLLLLPDLLELHFPQLERATGIGGWEVVMVVNPFADTSSFRQRLEGLVDLYGVPAKVVFLSRPATWADAMNIGVENAVGEHVVLLDGHTLCFDPAGLASLIDPLVQDRSVAITAPVVRHFDATVRSAGFQVEFEEEPSGAPVSIEPVSLEDSPRQGGDRRLAACSSDCLALRRSLFRDLEGLTGIYTRPDLEAVDLGLRARRRGLSVVRVPAAFTRFSETAAPPALPTRIPPDQWDYYLLTRRRSKFEVIPREVLPSPLRDSQSDEAPFATVVIPTLNPGSELAEVLDRLERQEGCPPFEILVIDSGSHDGTRRLLNQRGIRHRVIDRRDFNHGLTRNFGIREARGKVVALLSQDALPEPCWLAGLVAAFVDPEVAGAYSRQVPRPKASQFVEKQLSRWPASGTEPRSQEIPSLARFSRLSLEDQLAMLCFDNVSSAVRRSVALAIPFRALPFGEDRDWSYRVQAAGYAIRFCPASVVIHSHERSSWYQLRRTFVDHRLILQMLEGGTASERNLPTFLSWWGSELSVLQSEAAEARTAWRRFRSRMAAPFRSGASVAGSYLAIRATPQVASGSRSWRWVKRRLSTGL